MLERNKGYSALMYEKLGITAEPIALKLIKEGDEVPKSALRPVKDLGGHIAICQAFTMTRREKKTLYLEKGDHWCWNPLIGFGHVDCSEGTKAFEIVCSVLGFRELEDARKFFAKFPRLPMDTCKGVVVGPLCDADYEPDVTLIYCDLIQIRSLLWSIKNKTGKLLATELDAIDSCVYSSIAPILTGEYRVTLPDYGETERALSSPEEIILSVPRGRLEELLSTLYPFPLRIAEKIELDFPQPPFYTELFDIWGLN